MKKSIHKKLIRFYLWVGLGYFFMGFISTIGKYPDRFFAVVFNNFWGVIYVTVLNCILFEYAVPFVLKKKKNILYNIFNILVAILLFCFFQYCIHLVHTAGGCWEYNCMCTQP
jgi:hypothetical protein